MKDDEAGSSQSKDLYFVAVKLFLRGGEKLLITHDLWGAWDLVGGRLRTEDFDTPLESVIDRKVHEELGGDIRYSLEKPTIFFRHERQEAGLDNQKVRIFAVGYEQNTWTGKSNSGITTTKWNG